MVPVALYSPPAACASALHAARFAALPVAEVPEDGRWLESVQAIQVVASKFCTFAAPFWIFYFIFMYVRYLSASDA